MYRHVACLLAFAGVLCSRPVYADITSTGTFTNANLIWANGIAGLKFTFTDSCGGIQTCSFSWGHDGSTILISRSFTGTITCPATSDYGLVCNSDGLNLVSTITILNGLTKNLTEISISGATTGSFSRTITLLTCPRFPGANELTSDGCTAYNHNCESTFGCGDGYVGGDFTRTCTFDATWDNATSGCVKNLTFGDPDRDDGIAIGSTARVNTSVTDGIPINGDYTINWKAGTVIVASYSLTTSGAGTVTYPSSVFKGRINLSGTTAANMAVVVQNLSSSDNGTQLSVCALHGGLDAGSSNSIELEVRECPSFSDAEPVEETCNPYHFDCTTTFRCNIAGNIFTATCLSNATFDSRSECACCPRLDDGKLAAIGLGCIYLLLMLIVVIVSAKMEPKSSDHPDSVKIETSGTTQYIVFKYADGGVEKRTLKIDAGQYPNGSTSAITERTVVRRNCVGKISWSSDGDKNQAYMVLVLRERVVVDEKIIIGGSYMHWMASSCEYTYVIIPIGNRQIGKPVKHKTEKKRFIKNFWALLFFIFSLILIIIGVALLASSPNSDCCKNNCDACGLSPTGHGGFAPAILAILMLVILLVWMFLESCCPSGCLCCIACACLMCACCCCYCCKPKGKEEGSGNSEPEATRMMTENV